MHLDSLRFAQARASHGALAQIVHQAPAFLQEYPDSDGFCGLQGYEFSLDISVSMR
jgi:hypothetical protein